VLLAINTDTNQLIKSLSVPERPLISTGTVGIEAKRGDSVGIGFRFGSAFGTAVEIDAAAAVTWRFGAKVAGDYNGTYVFNTTTGTKTGTGASSLYTFSPDLNTTKLNKLFGYDPNGFAEVTEIRCLADVAGSLHLKWRGAIGCLGSAHSSSVWASGPNVADSGAAIRSQ
jgi:hypothetical protein